MGVRVEPKAQLHPRHLRDVRQLRERRVIASRFRASARDLFPALRERLLASRPSLGFNVGHRSLEAYGPPTFRNVIDENGQHV